MPISKRIEVDGKRVYVIDGTNYDSVTSALSSISKPALIAWAAKQGSLANMKATQDAAMGIGSEAHEIIDHYLKATLTDVHLHEKKPEVLQAFDNFKEWATTKDFRIVDSEVLCYSPKHLYAGTLDALAYIDGKLCIADWKTSSGIWGEYWLQTEAYAAALEEMHNLGLVALPGPITHLAILRLSKKDSTFEPRLQERRKRYFDVFISALDVYKWQCEDKKESNAYYNKKIKRKR